MTLRLEGDALRLAAALEAGLPLVPRPFEALGQEMGLASGEGLRLARGLAASGALRRMGPVYDSRALGLVGTLAAVRVAELALERAARAIALLPEVTHLDEREHEARLWLAAMAPGRERLEALVEEVRATPGVERVVELPAARVFKVSVRLGPEAKEGAQPHAARAVAPITLDETDRAAVRATQAGLALVQEPFRLAAESAGLAEKDLLARMEGLLARGTIRRVAGVFDPGAWGLAAGALCLWRVPDGKVEPAARALASVREVTHVVERASAPELPYNLYAMLHAAGPEVLGPRAEEVARGAGLDAPLLVPTVRVLKRKAPAYVSGHGAFPVSWILAGRLAVIAGGGEVAARKARAVLETGGRVRLVAPEVSEKAWRAGAVEVRARGFEPRDLDGASLVFACTDDPGENACVAAAARAAGVPVNVADDPAQCDFLLPAVARAGRVSTAVSTGGASPALAAALRDRVADALPGGLGAFAALLAEARGRVLASGLEEGARRALLREIGGPSALDALEGQGLAAAAALVRAALRRAGVGTEGLP